MKKDSLFDVNNISEDFEFNDQVVEVFDDMLERSVPFYEEVIRSSSKLIDVFLEDDDRIIDLGCSTGNCLLQLARLLSHKKLQYTGIDNSISMLEKARLKTDLYSGLESVEFMLADITQLDFSGIGCFVLNYTLQFVRPIQRQEFLQRLHNQLRPGGIIILSEKTIIHHPRLNREYIDIYHRFKKNKGYSELEIARKREALENVLIPFSSKENIALLENSGFKTVQPFFQWFNFCSLIGIKE